MSVAKKLTTVAQNQQKVYDAGKQAEYDRFWDAFQQNGNRWDYTNGFCSWSDEIYKPKYHPIYVATNMYANSTITKIDELSCELLGGSPVPSSVFSQVSTITTIGKFITQLFDPFGQAVGRPSSIGSVFKNLTALTEIRIKGAISYLAVFQFQTKLSRESIESIFAALDERASGQTVTFSQTAVDTAFETAEGAADGSTSEQWLALVASKSNWSVTLI